MDSIDSNTHSFIIKVWLEEVNDITSQIIWRGHITHVQDGKRRYVDDFDGMKRFIEVYLKDMGVECSTSRRVALWFRRLALRLKRRA